MNVNKKTFLREKSTSINLCIEKRNSMFQKTAVLTWENLDVNVIPNKFDIKSLKNCFNHNKQEVAQKINIINNGKT